MQICFQFLKLFVVFYPPNRSKYHNTHKLLENNLAIDEKNRLLICEIVCCLNPIQIARDGDGGRKRNIEFLISTQHGKSYEYFVIIRK